jgi:hypothetical protein
MEQGHELGAELLWREESEASEEVSFSLCDLVMAEFLTENFLEDLLFRGVHEEGGCMADTVSNLLHLPRLLCYERVKLLKQSLQARDSVALDDKLTQHGLLISRLIDLIIFDHARLFPEDELEKLQDY